MARNLFAVALGLAAVSGVQAGGDGWQPASKEEAPCRVSCASETKALIAKTNLAAKAADARVCELTDLSIALEGKIEEAKEAFKHCIESHEKEGWHAPTVPTVPTATHGGRMLGDDSWGRKAPEKKHSSHHSKKESWHASKSKHHSKSKQQHEQESSWSAPAPVAWSPPAPPVFFCEEEAKPIVVLGKQLCEAETQLTQAIAEAININTERGALVSKCARKVPTWAPPKPTTKQPAWHAPPVVHQWAAPAPVWHAPPAPVWHAPAPVWHAPAPVAHAPSNKGWEAPPKQKSWHAPSKMEKRSNKGRSNKGHKLRM